MATEQSMQVASGHAIPELDRKGLRDFGLVTGAILAVIFGLFFPWLLDRPTPRWPWVIAGVLGIMGLAAPMALRPIYTGWMKFGLFMSRITTPIIMGAVFYMVVSPIGLILKILGKDQLSRRLDKAATTYRVTSASAPSKRLEKPF
jgi:hypothetical protein